MPRLVEDAGGELSAGHLFKRVLFRFSLSGTDTLGGRAVAWKVVRGGVTVTHPPANSDGPPVTYTVPTVTTELPSKGVRRWWACPQCERRVDSLYLPAGRDRLGCRRCSRLTYRSQQTKERVRGRKARPGVWVEVHAEEWRFNPASLRMVKVVDRRETRRL